MTALHETDRKLLDFLCSVEANRHCIVRSVKVRLRPSLRRLRYAGLVCFEGFTPSSSAMADWLAQHATGSPVPSAGEEQPTPKAAEAEGGAVARKVSAPPMRKVAADDKAPPRPTGEQVYRLLMIEAERRGMHQTAVSMAVFGNAVQMTNMKTSTNPMRESTLAKARAWLEPPKHPRPFEPERPNTVLGDKQDRTNGRRAAAIRRTTSAKARERIEQGLPANGCKQASVRHAQFAIERENEIAARLADPIEQAKQALRKRYTPVLNAETMGGEKGQFIVGRKTVSEAELLAMAGRAA